ncbi:hypothetical protein ACCS54_20525 [Rhizobium johnstonii]|uniref:hypothetical protein n=1 Tax=Rhizobium johnstonii TaxID=3019933 RepID=UPI003F975155
MKRRITIPQRKRTFLGCEGESEQSYGALLARIVGKQKTDFFLDTVLLRPGGGDPLALVELAEKKKKQGVKVGTTPQPMCSWIPTNEAKLHSATSRR